MTDYYIRNGTDYAYHREDTVGARPFQCPVPSCERTGYGEQPPACPDHPYLQMEDAR